MDIHIDVGNGRGPRDEIYRQIRAAILDGRLRQGDAVPPTRELARQLAVARNTVGAAYDRLTAEGFLEARAGAGTFVRTGAATAGDPRRDDVTSLEPLAVWSEIPEPAPPFHRRPDYDFRTGVPDVGLFPFEAWRRLLTQQVRRSRPDVLTYGDPRGYPALRAEIARHVGLSRNVRTSADDVLVTNGSQQAVDLIARVLLRPGDRVAVENPGYPLPRHLFVALGAGPVGVRVDEEGIVVDEIPGDCRVVYVTPSHQFPLGVAMSLRRRLDLISWAETHGAAIIEDDYDTEFRFTGRPLEPLHSLDSSGRVIYVGSFTKVLFPALRLGFLVAPAGLHGALRRAKHITDLHSASVGQAALAAFMAEGGFARHLRRLRREYQLRKEEVERVVRRDFAGTLALLPSSAGLHVSAFSREPALPLVRDARRAGVWLNSLDGFGEPRGSVHGLVFGYGAVPVDRIEPGLRQLHAVMDGKQ